jgi:hypothetical protein
MDAILTNDWHLTTHRLTATERFEIVRFENLPVYDGATWPRTSLTKGAYRAQESAQEKGWDILTPLWTQTPEGVWLMQGKPTSVRIERKDSTTFDIVAQVTYEVMLLPNGEAYQLSEAYRPDHTEWHRTPCGAWLRNGIQEEVVVEEVQKLEIAPALKNSEILSIAPQIAVALGFRVQRTREDIEGYEGRYRASATRVSILGELPCQDWDCGKISRPVLTIMIPDNPKVPWRSHQGGGCAGDFDGFWQRIRQFGGIQEGDFYGDNKRRTRRLHCAECAAVYAVEDRRRRLLNFAKKNPRFYGNGSRCPVQI